MRKGEPRPACGANLWSLAIAFLLASPLLSSSLHPRSREEGDASSAADLYFSSESIAAFSNATANGVRREGVDTALRKYAFMALSRARTGIIYNVSLPPFLNGILCQAMRVRAGSARKRGLLFNEFTIPRGMVVQTGGPFVIMVYRKIFNFTLYSAPPGYELASPVVGIVIYTNLNTTLDNSPLPEMRVLSTNSSIMAKLSISYESLGILPGNNSTRFGCAYYDINGTASFTNVSIYPNTCSFQILTDVAIIVPSSAVAVVEPPPGPAPVAVPPSSSIYSSSKYSANAWKITVFAVMGVIGALVILIVIFVMLMRAREDERPVTKVDEKPDEDEALQTSLIGHTRAPTASGVRTKPVLETGSLHT